MIKETMKAAVLYGPKDIRVEEVPIPIIGKNEVLIKVKYCGICPSDIKDYFGIRSRIRKDKQTKPAILGHEYSGDIVEVGEKVNDFAPYIHIGMRAVGRIVITCDKCIFCQNGLQNMCPERKGAGTYDIPGAYAEYIKIPGKAVESKGVGEIPNSLNYREACLEEPVAACLNGILQTKIKIGDPVVIIGGGPIGLIHVQLARLIGGILVILIEPIRERRELALKLGADNVIDPTERDVVQEVMNITDNLGSCLTIVATSVPSVIPIAFQIARRNSQLLLFAGFPEGANFNLDLNIIHYRQINVFGSSSSTISQRKRALDLIAMKRVKVAPLISDTLPIERIEEGLSMVSNNEKLKILIKF